MGEGGVRTIRRMGDPRFRPRTTALVKGQIQKPVGSSKHAASAPRPPPRPARSASPQPRGACSSNRPRPAPQFSSPAPSNRNTSLPVPSPRPFLSALRKRLGARLFAFRSEDALGSLVWILFSRTSTRFSLRRGLPGSALSPSTATEL